MATIQWMFVFCVLIIEVVMITLLLVPQNNFMRGLVLNLYVKVWDSSPKVRYVIGFIFLITFVFFVEAMWNINKIDHRRGVDGELMSKLKLFQNQRNAYITGFTLFLSLILWRFRKLIQQLHDLTNASIAANTKKKE